MLRVADKEERSNEYTSISLKSTIQQLSTTGNDQMNEIDPEEAIGIAN